MICPACVWQSCGFHENTRKHESNEDTSDTQTRGLSAEEVTVLKSQETTEIMKLPQSDVQSTGSPKTGLEILILVMFKPTLVNPDQFDPANRRIARTNDRLGEEYLMDLPRLPLQCFHGEGKLQELLCAHCPLRSPALACAILSGCDCCSCKLQIQLLQEIWPVVPTRRLPLC